MQWRFYLLDAYKLRLFRQKDALHRLTRSQPVDLGTPEAPPAPKPAPPPLRQNEGAHRFLDHLEAVGEWWSKSLPSMQASAHQAAAAATEFSKPVEPFALRELPDVEERAGLKTDAALMRQWFQNPAYAVQSKEQKQCAKGTARYPLGLVNTSILKMATLLQNERFKAVYDRIKSDAFLSSPPVLAALTKSLEWVQRSGFDLEPTQDFRGDVQQIHRKYAFASLPVSRAFPDVFADVRGGDVEKSADTLDDVALGDYRLYVAVGGWPRL